MASLAQYLKHVENNGADMVLETAARDKDLTDAEYLKLHIAAYEGATGKSRAGMRKLADRDVARHTT